MSRRHKRPLVYVPIGEATSVRPPTLCGLTTWRTYAGLGRRRVIVAERPDGQLVSYGTDDPERLALDPSRFWRIVADMSRRIHPEPTP